MNDQATIQCKTNDLSELFSGKVYNLTCTSSGIACLYVDDGIGNPVGLAGDDPINNLDPGSRDTSGACWAQAGRALLETTTYLLAGSTSLVGAVLGIYPYYLGLNAEPHDAQGNFLC